VLRVPADDAILARMPVAAGFAIVGLGFLALWLRSFSQPGYVPSASSGDWLGVLSFSAALMGLAVALLMFARMIGGSAAPRVSLIPATGAALAAVTNVIEDGLLQEWAFWGFVLSAAITALGLVALTLVVALKSVGYRRTLAAIPAATLVGQLSFTTLVGILLPAAWLTAAVLVLRQR
jgi:hypothetical protein